MVNQRISEDLKECALRLWNHGWDVKDVCEAFGISRTSCYRWRQILEEHGTIKRLPSPLTGRTPTITRALLSAIQHLFAVDADLFLDEVCAWLALEHHNTINSFTVARTLEQAGLTRTILQSLLLNVITFVGRSSKLVSAITSLATAPNLFSSTKLARMSEPMHDIIVGRQEDSEHN